MKKKAVIREDDAGKNVVHRVDALHYFPQEMKITGTSGTKFHNMFHLARVFF